MKKLLLALCLLLGSLSAFAQISIPDSYYINRAKKQLEAEEAKKERKIIVIGTCDGCLSYVIRDGKRQSFVRKVEPKAEPHRWWCAQPSDYIGPLRLPEPQPVMAPEPKRDENDFARLLEELSRQRWMIISVSGNSDSAVYVHEKMEKRK